MSTPVAIALGILVNCIWGLAFLVPHLAFVFIADWRMPALVDIASAVLILTGVIVGIRATLRAAMRPAVA